MSLCNLVLRKSSFNLCIKPLSPISKYVLPSSSLNSHILHNQGNALSSNTLLSFRSFHSSRLSRAEVIGGSSGVIRGQLTRKKLKFEEDVSNLATKTGVSFTKKPVVALIGKPNVGKSTLFNILIDRDQKKAITSPVAGTTRDRSYGNALWLGREFTVIDTGGLVGVKPTRRDKSDPVLEHIRLQTLMAMKDADIIVFVVDTKDGISEYDKQIATFLRTKLTDKKVILVANKADNIVDRGEEEMAPYERLGLGTPLPLSAIHSNGVGDILDRVIEDMPVPPQPPSKRKKKIQSGEEGEEGEEISKEVVKASEEERSPSSIRVAIVGQPNVGKSSMMNNILREDRVIVSEVAGTTHDSVDTEIEWNGKSLTLVDTAGITKQGKRGEGLDNLIVMRALKTIERAHVVVLLIDPVKGVNSQDSRIASHIIEHNKSVIVAVNKWDLLRDKPTAKDEYMKHIRATLRFLEYVPVEFTSARTGYRTNELLDLAVRVFQERSYRFTTKKLNDIVENALEQHMPTMKRGKTLKVKFVSQADQFPPTFIFFVNDPTLVNDSYKRYLENALRERHKFMGTPIQLVFKKIEAEKKKSTKEDEKDDKKKRAFRPKRNAPTKN